MGLFKWLKENLNKTFVYIIDLDTLKKYLKREIEFSIKENLQASADLNIFLNGEKHHIQVWNFSASDDPEEKKKGLIIYFNDTGYKNINELIERELRFLPEYFKIELTLSDDAFLNEYKARHPELREEDYQG